MFRKNRVPWIVGGVLVLALGIGALAMGGGKKKSVAASPPESARALVVPANRPRTVVVPPCNTPVRQTAEQAASGEGTPGATILRLPRGTQNGVRTVLVPHCQPGKGSTNLEGNIPSAAFLIGGEERLPEDQGSVQSDGAVAKSQLVLPENSTAAIIVVPGCVKEGGAKGQDAVLGEPEGGADAVIAPSC